MGKGTEFVFVEGHSQDGTYEVIKEKIASHSEWKCKLLRQAGKGKGDAVRLGFEKASGNLFIILDADMGKTSGDFTMF